MKKTNCKQLLILLIAFTFFSFTYAELSTQENIREEQSINAREDNKILKNIKNKQLSKEIKSWLGTPYKHGSCSKKGTDCSGFVQSVIKSVYGVTLPRSSKDQYEAVKPIKKQRKLKEGDLVFFKIKSLKVSHVGIYLHDGYFVHASTKKGVVINNLEEDYYTKYYFKGGRITEEK